MNAFQESTANPIASALVHLGSPVSTTHVSCCSLSGLNLVRCAVHGSVIVEILLARLFTLPVPAFSPRLYMVSAAPRSLAGVSL